MPSMRTVRGWVGLVLLFLAVGVFVSALTGVRTRGEAQGPSSSPSAEEVFARAEELFPERYRPEVLDELIALYEGLLPRLETLPVEQQAQVLNRLAQLHYEKSVLREGDTDEDRQLLEKGKEYGLRSLRLNPDFAEWEARDFAKAVSFVTDVGALLWTADNWGGIFQFDPLAGLTGVGKLIVMHRRCLELEEAFWGASCHNALGAILVTSPGFLGGDPEEGKEHLERAIELAPDYLTNHVVYAEYWGFTYDAFGNKNGVRDRELIERTVELVREAPIGEWPFWNRIAKRDAERLLEELEEFTAP